MKSIRWLEISAQISIAAYEFKDSILEYNDFFTWQTSVEYYIFRNRTVNGIFIVWRKKFIVTVVVCSLFSWKFIVCLVREFVIASDACSAHSKCYKWYPLVASNEKCWIEIFYYLFRDDGNGNGIERWMIVELFFFFFINIIWYVFF